MYVDWYGNFTPLRLHYSPLNLKGYYKQGKTLSDAHRHPFLARVLRRGQKLRIAKVFWDLIKRVSLHDLTEF
jgi:hypothetical protein